MRLLGKPVKDFTPQDIDQLIEAKVAESKLLDYKETLPGRGDDDKREFLADTSSFANAAGGVIVFGVEEERDVNNSKTGLPKCIKPLQGSPAAAEAMRLEQIVRSGLEPQFGGVEFKAVEMQGGFVLLMGIEGSIASPHRVTYRNDSRFWTRGNSGKAQMSIQELRRAFMQKHEWQKEVEDFRHERLLKIYRGDIIPGLWSSCSLVLHAFPLGRLDTMRSAQEVKKAAGPFRDGIYRELSTTFNLDGFLMFQELVRKNIYIQFFRNGAMELYRSDLLRSDERAEDRVVRGQYLEHIVMEATQLYIETMENLDMGPPIVICLSLSGTKGVPIFYSEMTKPQGRNGFDRSEILVPGCVIESHEVPLEQSLKYPIDIIWQAAGWSESPEFIRRWTERRKQ